MNNKFEKALSKLESWILSIMLISLDLIFLTVSPKVYLLFNKQYSFGNFTSFFLTIIFYSLLFSGISLIFKRLRNLFLYKRIRSLSKIIISISLFIISILNIVKIVTFFEMFNIFRAILLTGILYLLEFELILKVLACKNTNLIKLLKLIKSFFILVTSLTFVNYVYSFFSDLGLLLAILFIILIYSAEALILFRFLFGHKRNH